MLTLCGALTAGGGAGEGVRPHAAHGAGERRRSGASSQAVSHLESVYIRDADNN
jgi:hypothetical protein